MSGLIKKPTQCDKVLNELKKARGRFISGRYFCQTMGLTQYHARIWELQKRGHNIIPSENADEFGFKSYCLVDEMAKRTWEKINNVRFSIIDQNNFMAYGANKKTYKVKIADKGKILEDIGKPWTCECEDYRFGSERKCKHIKAIIKFLEEAVVKGAAENQGKMF